MLPKAFGSRSAEMLPGQNVIFIKLPLGQEFGIKAVLFKGILPKLIIKTLIPQIESCAASECSLNHIT